MLRELCASYPTPATYHLHDHDGGADGGGGGGGDGGDNDGGDDDGGDPLYFK